MSNPAPRLVQKLWNYCNILRDDGLSYGAPPPLPTESKGKSGTSLRKAVAILLSLCLGLFLADAVVSLVDDSLGLLFGIHPLTMIRGLVFLFATLIAVVVYGLMGLTPMIPKGRFLPLTLFGLAAQLALVPCLIYFYDRLPVFVWGISVCQVVLGLGILYWSLGGLKFRWPLVAEGRLGARRFSWLNLIVFLLLNLFVLLSAVVAYVVLCTSLAVGHFSDGFLTLRPDGLTVQVRKYVRNDGKTIQLVPMAHVGDSAFYRKLTQSFPTNSVILMEGVTDNKNLLTNNISYKRMATALGLAEQHEEFKPDRNQTVRADVDVDQFAPDTISILNMVMRIHSKGLNAETVQELMQFSPSPQVEDQLLDDLLTKRNQHLLDVIRARLFQSEILIVPWGAAHMPGIAKEIQKSGFRLDETQDYLVIRFSGRGNQSKGARP
jgi:hypothetical protein